MQESSDIELSSPASTREALHRLPSVLQDLFDERADLEYQTVTDDDGIDAEATAYGSRLLLRVLASSRPGAIDAAAEPLKRIEKLSPDTVDVALVVPYMRAAGARAARERGLNWIDLSGNAHLFGDGYYIHVEGRPDQLRSRGRPSSPFASKSARVARLLLLDPARWWRQAELAEDARLDDGHVSRIVRRLEQEQLLSRERRRVRPRDPDLLLDAWVDDYRFDRHDIITGHISGSGPELVEQLHGHLNETGIGHAFTGLPAAWLLDRYARFRLCSVYVHGDPRAAADAIGLRRNERGANVQLIGPDDEGVFAGRRDVDEFPCVAPVQVYLDLRQLPERAEDAAEELRQRLWEKR
jgi:hypothetical protein